MNIRRVINCLRCGWFWVSRIEPKRCPKCKSLDYLKPANIKRPPLPSRRNIGRPALNPIYLLEPGQALYIPKPAGAVIAALRRYMKKTGKAYEVDSLPGGYKIRRVYAINKSGPDNSL